jgi:hypothetical protein
MTSRFLAPAALAALLAAPAAAQDKTDLPPITAQLMPVGKLLADAKATMRTVLGPDAGPAVKKFEQMLEDKLGEKGFEGLDLGRPVGACLYLPEKLDFDKLKAGGEPDPEFFDEFYGFVAVPVTGEKEFLDLLKRLDAKVEKVKGAKGLYAVGPADDADDDAPPVRLRFHAGHAYFGINADDEDMAADELPPVADLLARGEAGQFSYRVYYQRLPAGLKDGFKDFLKKLPEWTAQAPLPDPAKEALTPLVEMYKRYGERFLADGDTAVVRVKVDPATGDAGYEVALTAKPKSPLAKEIAARKPSANDFAGLVGPNAAVGFVMQMPLFAPEIRDAVAVGLEFGRKATADQVPDEVKEIVAELWKGAGRTVKTGEFDLAAALTGPDKAGLFSAAAAISYAGSADLEKVLRKKLADAPEEIQNQVKLDAAKADGVSIHRMPAGLFLPPQAKKAFGDRPSVAVAFGPKGVYVTFGPDAIGTMKQILAAGSGPAKPLDFRVNPARMAKLAAVVPDEQGAKEVLKMYGTEDELLSLLYVSLESGSELVLRYGTNLKTFKQIFVGRAAGEP